MALILPLIAMLTKEPEMLQPDAFCEHYDATKCDCGSLGELTAFSHRPLAGLWGPLVAGIGGKEGKRKGGEGKGKYKARGRESGEGEGRELERAADWLMRFYVTG